MPTPLRPDFDAGQLRRIARESEDAKQVRRLLALAASMMEPAGHKRPRSVA
jgi:hypothetical protein